MLTEPSSFGSVYAMMIVPKHNGYVKINVSTMVEIYQIELVHTVITSNTMGHIENLHFV